LRIEFAGAFYHLTSRGNGGQAIYYDRRDRERYFELLEETCGRFGWRIHAYCQMTNHYHLFAETPQARLARGMRHLNGVYAQWFNRRHRSRGHLFQARYSAKLVQTEAHLLSSVRYIIQNPVRARVVEHPGEWPWSSYNATAGLAACPRFLTTDWLLGHFAADRATARQRFIAFIDEKLEPPLQARGDLYLGDEDFARTHAPNAPIPEIPRRHSHPVAPELSELLTDPGGAAISAAYRHGYTLAQIGEHLGLHYSTISRRLRAHDEPLNGRTKAAVSQRKT
jgi:REP element-mobilizing transposase RayT